MKIMAHRHARSFRTAYYLMTKMPNFPMLLDEKSLAKEGVKMRKIAMGATKSYRSMNTLITEST